VSDDVAAIARDLEAVMAAVGAIADRLRAIRAPAVEPQIDGAAGAVREQPNDLIPAAVAARLAQRSKPTMNRWCKKHPWNAPDGFAVFMRGRWFVSRGLFEAYLRSQ
jgi:hypothetical protein